MKTRGATGDIRRKDRMDVAQTAAGESVLSFELTKKKKSNIFKDKVGRGNKNEKKKRVNRFGGDEACRRAGVYTPVCLRPSRRFVSCLVWPPPFAPSDGVLLLGGADVSLPFALARDVWRLVFLPCDERCDLLRFCSFAPA